MLSSAVTRARLSDEELKFEHTRRRFGLVVAPLAFASLLLAPTPGLSPEAHRLAAIALATVVLWITEAVPLAIAALLGPALAVVMHVAPARDAMAPFADPLIFLFLGGFFLAEGLSSQGFDRRAALWLMSRRFVAGSPRRASAAVMAITFAFSMWISNTATTAMMIPIGLGLHATMANVVSPEGEPRRRLDRFAGGICLGIAYSASIGGVATPVGTGPNVIAMAVLERLAGVRIDFLAWMSFALPVSLAMLVAAIWTFQRHFPAPAERLEGLTGEVRRQLAELGSMHSGERRAVGVFLLAIAGWLAPSLLRLGLGRDHVVTAWATQALDEGIVAIVCASMLFFLPARTSSTPILGWERAVSVDWGTLMLLGGGLALGKMVFDTGLAQAIGQSVIASVGPIAASSAGLVIIATLLVLVLTEVTSNTATTTMMLPVIIGVAQAGGIAPLPAAICATMAASYAFLLPVSTPPNAMAYGTGLVRIDTMVKLGVRLDLVGYVLLVLCGVYLVPHLALE